MATIIDLQNSIKANASAEYNERIPEATRDNITAIGNTLLTYKALKDEWLDTLINKIAMSIVRSKMSKNKLAKFRKGTIPFGDTVEEIWIEIAKGENFNPDATDPFTKKNPSVKTIYHRQDRKLQYTVTVQDAQLRTAFRSESSLTGFVNGIINSLYIARTYDEYVMTKELFGSYRDGAIAKVDVITDQASALAFCQKVKQGVRNLSYMRDIYNKQGVMTSTDKDQLTMLIQKDVISALEMHLSGVYNLKDVLWDVETIEIDDFGSYTGRYAMLVSNDAPQIYDTLSDTESQRNGKGKYTNYFVNTWGLYSISLFENVLSFEIDPTPDAVNDLNDENDDTTVTD